MKLILLKKLYRRLGKKGRTALLLLVITFLAVFIYVKTSQATAITWDGGGK